MPTKQQPLPVVHQLQNAIRASGLSLNELGRRTGVSEGQLSRFLRGDRTLTLPAAARVCLYFGLELALKGNASPEGVRGTGIVPPPPARRGHGATRSEEPPQCQRRLNPNGPHE